MIPERFIKEFQDIYKEECGEEISRETALAEGIKLLCLVRLLRKLHAENPCPGTDPADSAGNGRF